MRVMVEVRWGKASGKKAVLEPGTTLRIGRADWRSDFAIEHDRQMSGIHCEVSWDGTRAVLRDKHSRFGTFLNGERVTEAPLVNGDWIKAADTNLLVYFEEHAPPKREAEIAMTEVKETALATLASENEPLFAVLDAGRNDRILELHPCSLPSRQQPTLRRRSPQVPARRKKASPSIKIRSILRTYK